jgi:hypothetical protein
MPLVASSFFAVFALKEERSLEQGMSFNTVQLIAFGGLYVVNCYLKVTNSH